MPNNDDDDGGQLTVMICQQLMMGLLLRFYLISKFVTSEFVKFILRYTPVVFMRLVKNCFCVVLK